MTLTQLMAYAGHTDLHTSKRYIDSGAHLRGQPFGEPHPPLPEALVRSTLRSALVGSPPKRVHAGKEKGRNPVGSDPSSHVALATPAGIEGKPRADLPANRDDLARAESTRARVSARTHVDAGPSDPLEDALALAAKAGRFDVVAQLAKELQAPRLAQSNVVQLSRRQGKSE